jgi:osmotically-inducible protein OsmY
MRRIVLIAGAIGAAVAYLFDPDRGGRRRAMARDRSTAAARRSARRLARLSRWGGAEAYGVTQRVRHRREEPKPQPDDVTLARKVETEIFRSPEVPKGKINVNAVDGVVELRGEADRPEMIGDLEDQVRNIPGVLDVRNMLHVPDAPAPTSPGQSSTQSS